MTDATPTAHPIKTLADYTAGGFQHAPTVVWLGGAEAVVLSRNGADTIDVYRDGVVSALPDLTPAAEVTDPVRRETAVYAALLDIDCMRRRATEEADRQRADHRELIRLICDHADARRRAGEACAHRSDKLLRALVDHHGAAQAVAEISNVSG
jgi:hypothetical protein